LIKKIKIVLNNNINRALGWNRRGRLSLRDEDGYSASWRIAKAVVIN